MAVGCGAKCAKGVLITFNFVFWLSGCALLGLGIWLLVDPHKLALFSLIDMEGHEPMMQYLAYGLVGVGGFVLLVGVIGCCGALQESKCLLVTYFITLFIVLGAELSIGILGVLYRTQLLDKMESGLTRKFYRDYGAPNKKAFTDAVDFTQFKFNCCGIKGPADYNNITWSNSTQSQKKNFTVSLTCCRLNNHDWDAWMRPDPVSQPSCLSKDPEENKLTRHQQGCEDKIQQWFKDESLILISVGMGIAGLEIFGMIFAICLCRSLGEGEA